MFHCGRKALGNDNVVEPAIAQLLHEPLTKKRCLLLRQIPDCASRFIKRSLFLKAVILTTAA